MTTNNSTNNITHGFTINLTQTTHGFSAGNVVYFNGTSYALAQANSAANAEVVGIVIASINANNFTLQYGGLVTGLSGLTAGAAMFLSPTSGGTLTSTKPTTIGQIVKTVLIAVSTTSGYLVNMLGLQL